MTQELLELKQFAFALYIGQNVMRLKTFGDKELYNLSSKEIYLRGIDKNAYLQLRPLSSITDDEAIDISNICGWGFELGEDLRPLRNMISNSIHIQNVFNISALSHLQQQGFALPIYFKGVQYSVEKLTELGIYQITELKQELI